MSMCLSLQLSMQSSFCGLSSTSYYSGRYVQMLTPQTVGIFNLISKTKYLGFESAELVALGRKIKMDWPELRSKAEALASSPSPPGNNKQIHVNHKKKTLEAPDGTAIIYMIIYLYGASLQFKVKTCQSSEQLCCQKFSGKLRGVKSCQKSRKKTK